MYYDVLHVDAALERASWLGRAPPFTRSLAFPSWVRSYRGENYILIRAWRKRGSGIEGKQQRKGVFIDDIRRPTPHALKLCCAKGFTVSSNIWPSYLKCPLFHSPLRHVPKCVAAALRLARNASLHSHAAAAAPICSLSFLFHRQCELKCLIKAMPFPDTQTSALLA